ncbi:MAG TPA: hypothetical protein VLG09_05465 [Candidatus Saccharimonadales bacterium]|nr:hypothetical protein [Candidatus Saccharimonadales bacterium]
MLDDEESVTYCKKQVLPLLRAAYAYYRRWHRGTNDGDYSEEFKDDATSYEYNERLYEAATLLSLHVIDLCGDWDYRCRLEQYGEYSRTHGYRTTEYEYVGADNLVEHRLEDLRHYLVLTALLVARLHPLVSLPKGLALCRE